MKNIITLGSILLLAGCVFGTSEPSVFYTLRAETAQQPVSQTKTTVGVTEVGVPNGLSKPQIMLNGAEEMQVIISETNRWSESLDTLIQRTLVNNLMGYLPNAFVKTKTYSSEQFKYTVSVDIDKMSGRLGGDAILAVWWQIQNADGKIVTRDYRVLTTPAGDSYESYTAAQSALINTLAQHIAKAIGNQ